MAQPSRAVTLLALSYLVVVAILLVGVMRLPRSRRLDDAQCPSVSVVVSARNEAAELPACIDSLLALDYPGDRLQLVLVDDRSTDATGALVDAAAAQHAHVVALHTERLPSNGLEAKARGLAHGIAHATGDWVLITDADARVPREWARHLLGRLTPATTMVGGTIVVRPGPWWGYIEGALQGFLQCFSLAAAGLGAPFACIGPNMGIRRDVYLRHGGLERARFAVAEDLALFAMARADGGEVQLYGDRPTLVGVHPVGRPLLIFSQLRRWLGGGVEPHPAYAVGLALILIWGLAVVVWTATGWLWGVDRWLPGFVGKLVGDALLFTVLTQRAALVAPLRQLIILQFAQLTALCFLPVSFAITRRIRWVGDGYAVHYDPSRRGTDRNTTSQSGEVTP